VIGMLKEVTRKTLKEREKRKSCFCLFSVFRATFAFFALPQTR
jgi:hypothetical protein